MVPATDETSAQLIVDGEPATWSNGEFVETRPFASFTAAMAEPWVLDARARTLAGQELTADRDVMVIIEHTCALLDSGDGPPVAAEVSCLYRPILPDVPDAVANVLYGCSGLCSTATGALVGVNSD